MCWLVVTARVKIRDFFFRTLPSLPLSYQASSQLVPLNHVREMPQLDGLAVRAGEQRDKLAGREAAQRPVGGRRHILRPRGQLHRHEAVAHAEH